MDTLIEMVKLAALVAGYLTACVVVEALFCPPRYNFKRR